MAVEQNSLVGSLTSRAASYAHSSMWSGCQNFNSGNRKLALDGDTRLE